MPHVRKSIRDALVTAVTGLATTGARVFPGRVYPVQDSELPGLLVFTDNEDIGIASLGVSRLLDRDADAVVEAVFKDTASLDDKGDTILSEVETATGPGLSLGGGKWLQLSRIEFERADEGEKPTARMRMIFKVRYITAHGAPNTAL